jgi:hypothetical protein
VTDSKYHTPETGSLEGRFFRPANPAELAEAIEKAFDFRGDVTLELSSGRTVEGYVFNRHPTAAAPYLEMFPTDGGSIRVPYAEIASIAFTGADTASGKTWEAWVAKKESQRRHEARQAEDAARARGHL